MKKIISTILFSLCLFAATTFASDYPQSDRSTQAESNDTSIISEILEITEWIQEIL